VRTEDRGQREVQTVQTVTATLGMEETAFNCFKHSLERAERNQGNMKISDFEIYTSVLRRWVDNIKMDLREIGWDGLDRSG
jgi:hypothetical protein